MTSTSASSATTAANITAPLAGHKGRRTPSEHAVTRDPQTGARVHQLTNASAVSHHLYFLTRSITTAGRVIFASYRTGAAQLFALDFPTGEVVQLTDGAPVHGYSPHLSPDDRRLYFVRNTPAAAESRNLLTAMSRAGEGSARS